MPKRKGVLATTSVSSKRAGALKKKLLVTTKVLNHLQKKRVLSAMNRAGCCKPDGGSCCVNKRVF